jgi:hypothetical protein
MFRYETKGNAAVFSRGMIVLLFTWLALNLFLKYFIACVKYFDIKSSTRKEVKNLNEKKFALEVTVLDSQIVEAYTYHMKNKKVFFRFAFTCPAGETKKLNLTDCEAFCDQLKASKWESLDNLFEFRDSIHMISIDKEN